MGTFAGHIGQRHQRSGVACFCGLPPFWRAHTPGDRVRPLWWKGYRPRVRPTWEPKGTKRDYGGSEDASEGPPPSPSPDDPTEAEVPAHCKEELHLPKGVILVSEAFTEINAGLVIVLKSGHTNPVPMAELMDINRDPDELAIAITEAYHRHVETYLATTRPPEDAEMAVSSGLLGSPLLGTQTRVAADWCHAWSLLGQWSGWVTFPVPASGIWPKHGHLRGILSGYQKRQPNFHKWARPAYEQGALPTLSTLPGEVIIKVLPGDKMYQAMEMEPDYMRPVILHGFGTRAKRRLPNHLADLASHGWMPMAAALYGSAEWKPQWMHHNFLPVIGLRIHAKRPPPPLRYRQLVLLLGLWERDDTRGLTCRALAQAACLNFGSLLPLLCLRYGRSLPQTIPST